MSTPPPTGPDPSDKDRPELPRLPEQQSSAHPEGEPPGYPSSEPPAGLGGSGYPPPGYHGHSAPGQPPPWHPEASPLPSYPGGSERAAEDPLVPADFAGWVNRIVGIFQRSLIPLLITQVPLAIAAAIISYVLALRTQPFVALAEQRPAAVTPEMVSEFMPALLLGLVAQTFVMLIVGVASVALIIRHAAGRTAEPAECLRLSMSRAVPTLGWGIVAWLLTTLGFFLLILPGLVLMLLFAASLLGVLTVEKGPVTRSLSLSASRFLPSVGRVLVAAVVAFVASRLIGLISGSLGQASIAQAVVSAVLYMPLWSFIWAFSTVTYAELRNHENPAVGTRQLADQLEGRAADL